MQSRDETTEWSPTIKLVVGVIVFVLIALALYALRAALVPPIVGAVLAYALYPVAARISERTKIPHRTAAALLYLAIIALVVPLVIVLIPVISRQAVAFQSGIVSFLNSIDYDGSLVIPLINVEIPVEQGINQLVGGLSSLVTSAGAGRITFILSAAQSVIYVLFTFVIAFYLTRDGDRFVAAVIDTAPPQYRDEFIQLIERLDRVWRSFIRGQLILSFTVFVIITLLATALGLPQPLVIGLLGGLLEFLPSIGNMIWGAIAITVALAQGSTWIDVPNTTFAIIVAVSYIAFAQLDINVLIPNIMGGQVKLHPAVVLVGVIAGLNIAGVLGVALAAPTIASARVILRYIYAKLFDLDPFPPLAPTDESDAQDIGELEPATEAGD
ncbi:MAG: AI-2E family transporter [Anaerolineae bacterium]